MENQVKGYEGLSDRRKILRFLEDNSETYLDYPDNRMSLVDREDSKALEYYKTTFSDYCKYGSLAMSTVLGLGMLYRHQANSMRIMNGILASAAVPGAIAYHYFKMGQFLDYCSIKYEARGLNDNELWQHHMNNSRKVL